MLARTAHNVRGNDDARHVDAGGEVRGGLNKGSSVPSAGATALMRTILDAEALWLTPLNASC